ncbi:MAG: DNA translocase FtsK [bacterium]
MFFNKKEKFAIFSPSKNSIFTYKKEIIAVLLLSVFAIFAISFFSFNPHDPSWFYFASDKTNVTNWAGSIGANVAALFFYYLGSASYVVLFALIFLIYLILFKKDLKEQASRFVALFILLLTTATLLRAFSLDISKTYPGGWIGEKIYNLLQPYFGFFGVLIILFMFFWISSALLFRYSFLNSVIYVLRIFKTWVFYAVKFFLIAVKYIFKYLWELLKAIWCKIKSKFSKKGGGPGEHEWEEYKKSMQGKSEEEKIEERDPGNDKYDILESLSNLAQKSRGHFFASTTKDSNLSKEIKDDPKDLLDGFILGDEHVVKIIKNFQDKQLFKKLHEAEFLGKTIKRLPNTVFNKNIFQQNPNLDNLIPYQFILCEINAIKKEQKNQNKKILIKYNLPDLSIFKDENGNSWDNSNLEAECAQRAKKLEEKLHRFGIRGNVTEIKPGPLVTLFEFKPEIDSKISRIIALEDDLAMALTATSIRIIAPIPGKNVVGFEIANQSRNSVHLSDLMLKKEFENFEGNIPLALGVDIVGKPVIEDLLYMPHLLVAGSTGSGKSVGLNAMLIGLLCKFRPDELKLILIDPKRLEFAPYADIPHLLFPIITNPRQAAPVLKWVVQEMEARYEKMASIGVRNILEYQKVYESSSTSKIEEFGLEQMPLITIMIDELADLMMVAGKDVETQIARIAQMARAAGIHMIVATQRPSVDVVTGLIKVNFPSRIAYRVSSKIDSRTIVDSPGAEKLLGRGDMLYLNSSSSDLHRLHGAYVSDEQVEKLTTHLKRQQKPEYLDLHEELKKVELYDDVEFEDDLYDEIVEFVKQQNEISISMIQRHYRIGFNRSARIIERLELDGLIAPAQGSKPRKVLSD